MKIMQITLLVLVSGALNAMNTSLSSKFGEAFKNMPTGVTVTQPTNPGVTNQLIVVRTPQGDQTYTFDQRGNLIPASSTTSLQNSR